MVRSVVSLSLLLSVLVGCAVSAPDASSEPVTDQSASLTSYARPTKLTDLDSSSPLRLSATHVYFHDHRAHAVKRVAKAGGPVETVLAADAYIRDFAMDGTHLYAVLDKSTTSWGFGEIVRTPLAGGPIETKLGGELVGAKIAVDDRDVYVSSSGKLSRFPKNGSFFAPETLVAVAPNVAALAVDAANLYWADMGPGNPAIGCNMGDGKIVARSKLGGEPRVVADRQDCPLSIAVDGSNVWFRSFSGPLLKVPTTGGRASTVAETTLSDPATDGTSVFFGVANGHTAVLKSENSFVSLDRTFVNTRTPDGWIIPSVAVDASHVFYLVQDSQYDAAQLLRVAK